MKITRRQLRELIREATDEQSPLAMLRSLMHGEQTPQGDVQILRIMTDNPGLKNVIDDYITGFGWKPDFGSSGVHGLDMSGLDLSNVDLSGANLEDALLSGTNLSGADFSAAHLNGADLWDANFTNTNFSYADLTHALFIDSDLDSANLDHTIGLLSHAIGYEGINTQFNS